ncbi:MAG: hypothetical protein ACT6S0_10995 [Roseateles sp.]|uniref:hypothetical protein n=1 Tax=Roseateles sp. TaxID=1971397 RepID=UPI0040374FA0
MNTSPRWIAFASFATVFILTSQARAFTDANAALKEAAADRTARVVIIAKAARAPVQTVWVPATAKSLDGFKPVLPEEGVLLARAGAPARIGKR